MSKNEPAFPIGSGDMRDPIGLTKLEWFAGEVIKGLSANPNLTTEGTDRLAAWAFDQAEAMLAEAEKRK